MTNHFLRSCPRGKPVHVARIGPQSWTVTVPLPGDVSGSLNQFNSTFGHPIEFTCPCLLSRNTCTCCVESIYDFWTALASFVSFAHESYGSLVRFENVRKRFIQFYIDLPTVLEAFHGSGQDPKDARRTLIEDAHSVLLSQYGEDVADIPWMDWPSCGSDRMTEEHAAELFSADVSVLSHIRALLNRKFGTQSSSNSISMEKVLAAKSGFFILQLGSVLDQLCLSELSEKVLGHFLKNEASFVDAIPFDFLRRINKTLSNTNKMKNKFYSVQYQGRSSAGDQSPPGEGGLAKLRDKLSRMLLFRKRYSNEYRDVSDGMGPFTLSPVEHYADARRPDTGSRVLPDLPFRANMLSTKSKSDAAQTVPRLPPPLSAAPVHRPSISFPSRGPSLKASRGPIADEIVSTEGDQGVDELFIPHQEAEVVSEVSSGREFTGGRYAVRVTPLDMGIPYLDKSKFSASPPSEENTLDLLTKIKGMGQSWPNREPTVVPEGPRPGNRMIRLRERLLEKAREEAAPPLQALPPEPTASREIYASKRQVLKHANQAVFTQKGGDRSDDELFSLPSEYGGHNQASEDMGSLSERPFTTRSEIPLIEDRVYTGSVRNSSRSGYTQSSATSQTSADRSDGSNSEARIPQKSTYQPAPIGKTRETRDSAPSGAPVQSTQRPAVVSSSQRQASMGEFSKNPPAVSGPQRQSGISESSQKRAIASVVGREPVISSERQALVSGDRRQANISDSPQRPTVVSGVQRQADVSDMLQRPAAVSGVQLQAVVSQSQPSPTVVSDSLRRSADGRGSGQRPAVSSQSVQKPVVVMESPERPRAVDEFARGQLDSQFDATQAPVTASESQEPTEPMILTEPITSEPVVAVQSSSLLTESVADAQDDSPSIQPGKSFTLPASSQLTANRGVGEVSVNDRLHAHKETGRPSIKGRRPKPKLPSVHNIDDWAAQAKADLDNALNLN